MTGQFAWLREAMENGLTLPARWEDGDETPARPVYETTADFVAAQHLALLNARSNKNLTDGQVDA